MVLIIFKLKEVSGLTPACKEEKRLMREWTIRLRRLIDRNLEKKN